MPARPAARPAHAAGGGRNRAATPGHRCWRFVFLSLEDETGIANIIVNPDVFAAHKRTIVDEPYLVVDGVLQNQDGAVSVKADRIEALGHDGPRAESHDFH